jgi:hypothetical protein
MTETVTEVQIPGETRPRGYCWCGCGQATTISTTSNTRRRDYKGAPKRFVRDHKAIGHGIVTVDGFAQVPGEDKPRGLCWCGCGQRPPLPNATATGKHQYAGVPNRYMHRHYNDLNIHKYEVDEATGCWNWQGALDAHGYSRIGWRQRSHLGHRHVWMVVMGVPIPDGLTLDHLCRNRRCVNPDHLEPVTNEENKRRERESNKRGDYATACGHGHELTPENSYFVPKTGFRRCRECMRLQRIRRTEREAAA